MLGKPDTALVSMGIYVFSTEFLLNTLHDDAAEHGSSHDFGKDIIPSKIQDSNAMAFAFQDEKTGGPAYWRDVGTLDSYWQANMEVCSVDPPLDLYSRKWPIWTYQTQHPPAKFIFDDDDRRGEAIDSLISAGCILSGARVKRSVVSFASKINSYSHIKDSVILPKVSIGRHCKITKAIIDKGCVLPEGMQIGQNLDDDRKRFHVTDSGLVLVTPDMLGQDLSDTTGDLRWRMKF
jgi:glucose-1-phosphate adenylyltransferase